MKKYLLLIFLFFGLLAALLFLPADPFQKEAKIFKIDKGQNLKEVALNLEKAGLIRWPIVFRFFVLARGQAKNIPAGSYKLSPTMNIFQISQKIIKGDALKIVITIPEGFTQKQIEERLGLELPDGSEGYLFPDTYHFSFDVTGEEAAKIMKENFVKKTAGLKITSEIVIMASILEKEVKTKEDKELVSGILWKRLKIGMPLQVDAELWTYQNRGLPPSPISNPGLESIKAATSPRESLYLYYLSAKDGATIFSKTFQEHILAKAKYLK